MTTSEYSPLLRDGSSRSNATQHHLAINSHYYDITDIESWPIAGLLVLLDGQGQPVRAELHLYDDLEPHVQEAAIRQARLVLQEGYAGGVPVPVRILETFQVREEMLVRLPPPGTPTHARTFKRSFNRNLSRSMNSTLAAIMLRWRPYAMIVAAFVVLVLLAFWLFSALNGGKAEEPLAAANAPTAASQPGDQAVAEVVTTGEGEEQVAPTAIVPAVESDLPVSRNARGDLGIGMRVQVVPGLRVALRSEPGADRGIVVGDLGEDEVATIIGGPQYTAGDSDTIVWWFVELSNTTQAWAAANTSQQTLLMPVQ